MRMDPIHVLLFPSQFNPLLCWWLSPIYSGLWPSSQMLAGRDPTTAGFGGGQEVHPILTKVVFSCKKPLVVTL